MGLQGTACQNILHISAGFYLYTSIIIYNSYFTKKDLLASCKERNVANWGHKTNIGTQGMQELFFCE